MRCHTKVFTLFFFTISVLFCSETKAQTRSKIISLTSDTLILDSLSIIPESFRAYTLFGKEYKCFTPKFLYGKIIIDRQCISANYAETPSAIKVFYRTFPVNFTEKYYHKSDSALIINKTKSTNPFAMVIGENDVESFGLNDFNKNGSISRGLSFGNNQDLTVNSNLNIQLSGKLNNNIDVVAAATDENIPIQPSGNTQQIQQFDKVYIQLSDEHHKLIAGDFQATKPNKSYFLNYYKRAQGGNYSTSINPALTENKNELLNVNTGVAVSKGKFSRNVIQGLEGNQGPYKLIGAQSEQFIVVLAGTEKVYVDGQLLTRGQENDYVIDYNTSEITFTAKKLITKDRRIIVEFQYSDKNYARSMFFLNNDYQIGRLGVSLNFYSEQDSKNKPLQQKLNDNQKLALAMAGDNPLNAIVPSFDSIGYIANEILYLKKDTIIDGTYLYNDVLVFSTDPELAYYKATFSLVGSGRGNYIKENAGVNGKVFKWVAPVNGIPQGDYEPIVLLITPKQRQMLTTGVSYQFLAESKASVELAVSKNDLNTFSKIDDSDNNDAAIKANIEHYIPIKVKDWKVKTALNYEEVNKHFTPIERFRSVEFERDWNITNRTVQDYQYVNLANAGTLTNTSNQLSNQYIGGGEAGFVSKKKGSVLYALNKFTEAAYYNGTQQKVNTNLAFKSTAISHLASYTHAQQTLNKSNFFRQKGVVTQQIKKIAVSFKGEMENNQFRTNTADSILSNSYRFNEWYLTLGNGNADSSLNKYSIYYTQRTDGKSDGNQLFKSSFAQGVGGEVQLLKNPNNSVKINSAYRDLTITNSNLTTQKPENTLLNRVEYDLRLIKSLLTLSTFYEIGSGQELKKEFSYILVQAGQGNYTWNDYNENGIKELNEFETAAFQDQANYIKVYTPTNIYVKTYSNAFNQVININPATLLQTTQNKGLKFLSKFSNQTTYRTDQKLSNTQFLSSLNPFRTVPEEEDSILVSENTYLRNTFYFNRSGGKIGIDLNGQNVGNKILLVNGFETRQNKTYGWRLRINAGKFITLNCEQIFGTKINTSKLSNRNYSINSVSTEPKISIQPSNTFRISLIYKYTDKVNNSEDLKTTAYINNYSAEVKYNIVSKANIFAKFSYVNILFDGDANTPTGYEMLEALSAGKNYTWNLTLQQNLSETLQLSLNYDGRKTSTSKMIHIGGVQLRANF